MAILTLELPGEDVDVGGADVEVRGTASGGETILITRGNISLDPSFALGGDEIILPGDADDYTARLSGSRVILTNGTTTVSVPVGTAGIDITFGDGTRTLVFDEQEGQVTLDGQPIGNVETVLQPSDPVLGTDEDDVLDDLGDESVSAFGGGGDDTIVSGAGNDFLYGEEGDDALSGGDGSDRLDGGSGDDSLSGDDDDDFLYGGTGDDLLDGGDGDDFIAGEEGADRAVFASGELTPVTVDLRQQGVAQDTGRGSDTLVGIESVSGDLGDDTLIGDELDNWLWGIAGNDFLQGNQGDDLLETAHGVQIVDGGTGSDTFGYVSQAGSPAAGVTISLLVQGVAQTTGWGSLRLTGIENLNGTQFDDELIGTSAANILAGSGGDDELSGGGGNDLLMGDGVVGIGGPAGGPIEVLEEGPGAAGSDILFGGDGDDELIGGGGADAMTGGAGADTFTYLDAGDSTVADPDVIDDFVAGTDRIDLSALDVESEEDQALQFVDEFSGDAGEVTVAYDDETNITQILIDLDGDAIADMRIDLSGNIAVGANDFIL